MDARDGSALAASLDDCNFERDRRIAQRMACMLAFTAAMVSPVVVQQYVYPAKARAACLEGKGYTGK